MPASSRESVAEIIRCLGDGRLEDGLSLCRLKLSDTPDDVNLVALLGAILLSNGDRVEAERHLLRATELEPEFAKPYEDLGALCLAQGATDRAITYFEKAIMLDGTLESAVKGLVHALHRSGRTQEAEELMAGRVAHSPELAKAHELRKAGDLVQASKTCEEMLRNDPDHAGALRLQAIIATDEERYAVAENLLRRLVNLAPGKASGVHDLASFLGERGRYPEAIEMLEAFAGAYSGAAEIQSLLGDMLAIVGRSADALKAYEDCLQHQADNPMALLGRAHMLRIEGQSDEAVATYRHCVTVWPEIGDAWWSLSTMKGFGASDADIDTMRSLIDSSSVVNESKIALHFAVARACEKRDEFDQAWEHYVAGNAGKRALVKYDPVETEVRHAAIRKVYSASFVAEKCAETPTDRTPIFIVGMPRSGSTLVEQILASHTSVAGCGELPYIIMLSTSAAAGRPGGSLYPEIMAELEVSQLTGLGRTYLYQALPHIVADKPVFTDKMPANFSHVGFIRQVLPHAKIIDVRRNPMATCVANYRQLFARGKNQSYDLVELGEYYLQYVDMMTHWDEVLPGVVLRVNYEDVVADITGQVQRILDFCELPFEDVCIDFHESERPVNTASSEQVRQPLYNSAVEFWKNYDAHLGELREVLAPIL